MIRYQLVAYYASASLTPPTVNQELYLYYFLLRYPGRSLVFVTSIDSIRRVLPLLENLQIQAYPLHSQLQQKQRLKNLDRFDFQIQLETCAFVSRH